MSGLRRHAAALGALAAFALCIAGCDRPSAPGAGDARRGAHLIASLGCGGCHVVPGVPGADGQVGPPLTGMGKRTMIAGMLPNTPDNMMTWLRTPQSVVPGNAMPNTEMDEHDAQDVAAYLDSLR